MPVDTSTGPTLTQFDLPDVLFPGYGYGWPAIQLAILTGHESDGKGQVGDTIKVTLDRPLLGHTGSSSVLSFTFSSGIAIVHQIAPYDGFVVGYTAQRGDYAITNVTVTDRATGAQTSYSANQLHDLGFDTDFTVRSLPSWNGILWRHANGTTATWQVNPGTSTIGFQAAGDFDNQHVDSSWTAVETMNFAGKDGAILWRNANGAVSIWFDGIGVTGRSADAYNHDPVGLDWSIAGTGDMNGDGEGDILWRNADGTLLAWTSTRSNYGYSPNADLVDGYTRSGIDNSWTVEGLADFNGDNRADILWWNADGSLSVWTATASALNTTTADPTAAATGFAESTFLHGPIDLSWHVVGLGDFNGDGKDDILWHNDNGALSVWTSTGSGFTENQMNAGAATSWNVAEVTDYNGDGLSDILWRNSNGAISVWESTGSGWAQNVFYDGSVGNDWTIVAHKFGI